jgi:hypothetical protein
MLDTLIVITIGADVGKETGSGIMNNTELICEAKRIIWDLRYTNDTYNDDQIADCIEKLAIELEIAQDLAERRLNRKNMYKERSERSLFEKERYRLDLEQVKRERDAAISDLIGECTVCKNSNECVKYPCYCINGSAWEWRGVPEDK